MKKIYIKILIPVVVVTIFVVTESWKRNSLNLTENSDSTGKVTAKPQPEPGSISKDIDTNNWTFNSTTVQKNQSGTPTRDAIPEEVQRLIDTYKKTDTSDAWALRECYRSMKKTSSPHISDFLISEIEINGMFKLPDEEHVHPGYTLGPAVAALCYSINTGSQIERVERVLFSEISQKTLEIHKDDIAEIRGTFVSLLGLSGNNHIFEIFHRISAQDYSMENEYGLDWNETYRDKMVDACLKYDIVRGLYREYGSEDPRDGFGASLSGSPTEQENLFNFVGKWLRSAYEDGGFMSDEVKQFLKEIDRFPENYSDSAKVPRRSIEEMMAIRAEKERLNPNKSTVVVNVRDKRNKNLELNLEEEKLFSQLEHAAIVEVIRDDEYIKEIMESAGNPSFRIDPARLRDITSQAHTNAWKKLEAEGYIAREAGR